jgi:AGCS family alanine or glycine:cation symporter
MVLLTDAHLIEGLEGVQISQAALTTSIGEWGTYFLTLCIFLFAFSSIIGNYYYGETNLEFIYKHPFGLPIYRTLVVLVVVGGAVAELSLVWNVADLFMAFVALTNLVAITLLSKYAIAAFRDYMQQKSSGKDPIFKASTIPGLEKTECWPD